MEKIVSFAISRLRFCIQKKDKELKSMPHITDKWPLSRRRQTTRRQTTDNRLSHFTTVGIQSINIWRAAQFHQSPRKCIFEVPWNIFAADAAAKSLQSCPTLCNPTDQPTRLLCPWFSPGKNTGVGCHFLLQCIHACQVASVVSDSVRPHGQQPSRLHCPQDSPGKNIGVGCHFLIPRINKSEKDDSNICWQGSGNKGISYIVGKII